MKERILRWIYARGSDDVSPWLSYRAHTFGRSGKVRVRIVVRNGQCQVRWASSTRGRGATSIDRVLFNDLVRAIKQQAVADVSIHLLTDCLLSLWMFDGQTIVPTKDPHHSHPQRVL